MRTYKRKSVTECIEPIENVLLLCRLCLDSTDPMDSIPIFSNANDMCTSLTTRIMMCVGYEVTREDCLPNTICTKCQKELNNFYEFKKKCTTTYIKLKSHLIATQMKKASMKQEESRKFVLSGIPQIESVTTGENVLLAAVNKNNSQDLCTIEPVTEVCSDVAEFLSSILMEIGIIKKQENEESFAGNCRTVQIETGDCRQITYELYEIDEDQNGDKAKAKDDAHKPLFNSRSRCATCGKWFATCSVMRRHARETHARVRPHRCAHCHRSFSQKAVLRRHELVHQAVRPFACPWCTKSFTQRAALESHARVHVPADARALTLHRCTKCPKMFLHASGLSRHASTHAGRLFRCAVCQRNFKDSSSLRRHQHAMHAPSAPEPPREP